MTSTKKKNFRMTTNTTNGTVVVQRLHTTCHCWRILLVVFLWMMLEVNCVAVSFPTKISGYGSRSKKSSIFHSQRQQQQQQSNTTTSSSTSLWIKKEKDENDNSKLWFYSSVKDVTFCCSVNTDTNSTVMEEVLDTTGTIDDDDDDDVDDNWVEVEGLYGIYPIVGGGMIWAFITSSSSIVEDRPPWGGSIRRVSGMELIYVGAPRKNKKKQRELQLCRQALKLHDWYYISNNRNKNSNTTCTSMDMTQTIQRAFTTNKRPNNTSTTSSITTKNWWEDVDSRFFWNEPTLQPLIDSSSSSLDDTISTPYDILLQHHTLIVTSAFVEYISSSNTNYQEVLLSRRNRFRAGTRFTQRGSDPNGNVANAVETEQVLLLEKQNIVCSHVQTRGSIPLRWSSPIDIKSYRPRVQIGLDPIKQAEAMQQHLQQELRQYNAINRNETTSKSTNTKLLFVNLIDKHSDQGRLGRVFDAILKSVLQVHPQFSPDIVQHLWYDFHAEVKRGWTVALDQLLKFIQPTLQTQGYFQINTRTNQIQQLQTGIIRTNCMDCLDRTNVVQSVIAKQILQRQLLENGITIDNDNDNDSSRRRRIVWANHADAISKLYAGTNALKGDFTRTGTRTKRGLLQDGINSMHRFYLNNFKDADKQYGFDIMTGVQSMSTTTTKKKQLQLRWLPGDLRWQVRDNLALQQRNNKQLVQTMDDRTASEVPWWVAADEQRQRHVTLVSILCSTIAILQAPITTAIMIVLLFLYFAES